MPSWWAAGSSAAPSAARSRFGACARWSSSGAGRDARPARRRRDSSRRSRISRPTARSSVSASRAVPRIRAGLRPSGARAASIPRSAAAAFCGQRCRRARLVPSRARRSGSAASASAPSASRPARRAGVALVEGIAVRGITTHRGRATGVRTERGTIAAPIVVNAAGAWAAAVAVPPGVLRPAVVPVRGQMVVLRGLPLARPLHGTDGYLAPRPDGRVLVGSTYERAGFAAQPTAGGVRALLTMAERLVPAVAGASVVGAYAGLRPGNPDGLPLVGAAPGAAGVWYACGLYRNGILLAPAVAAALADLLTTGETAWPVAALAPARLVSRRTTPRGPGRPRRDLRRS